MHERRRAVLAAVALTTALPALAAAQVPAGGEFQVNTYTTGGQLAPSASMDGAGDMVMAWSSERGGPGLFGISGQRFDAAGVRQGSELLFTGTAPTLGGAKVAMAAKGSFVVAWDSLFNDSIQSIAARRFSAAGVPIGQEFWSTSFRSARPSVVSDPDGKFVLAWQERSQYSRREIHAQRFDALANRLGTEFHVNTYTTSEQRGPALARDGQGNFVVVWRSNSQDGSGYGIFGQRFDAAAAALGAEFRVSSHTAADQIFPSVASSVGGRFVVAWGSDGQDGSGYGVFAQRFDALGVALGAEFRVNGYTTSDQAFPSVAADAAGNFVIAWTSYGQDGGADGVFARRFLASGAARGAEFRVNTYTAGDQFVGSAASDAQGNFVVTWTSAGQDGSGYGVFARRFGGLQPVALAVDTGANGVFEPGEVVDVVPSWRNVNGAAQTIGGTAVSFSGPQPAVYQVNTPFANYATIPDGATRPCLDCYRVTVPTTTRPVLHWDAVFDERLTPDAQGQEKLWRLHLGASFTDVPVASPFYRFVEMLLHNGITGGCGAGTYCPGSSSSREQMAVFVLVAKEGEGYRPPPCGTPMFDDVPPGSPFCPFIEELARRGVVSGCGGGSYCPAAAVAREQMPVFVLRTLDPALDPPACTTPIFGDVPASSPFCRWIEELARRGVVSGCGGGNYCPADPVTREQMAVFIAGAFGLTLYGP
jgi:hypothetical protein